MSQFPAPPPGFIPESSSQGQAGQAPPPGFVPESSMPAPPAGFVPESSVAGRPPAMGIAQPATDHLNAALHAQDAQAASRPILDPLYEGLRGAELNASGKVADLGQFVASHFAGAARAVGLDNSADYWQQQLPKYQQFQQHLATDVFPQTTAAQQNPYGVAAIAGHVGNVAPDVALATATGGASVPIFAGIQGQANSYNYLYGLAKQKGMSDDQASNYALAGADVSGGVQAAINRVNPLARLGQGPGSLLGKVSSSVGINEGLGTANSVIDPIIAAAQGTNPNHGQAFAQELTDRAKAQLFPSLIGGVVIGGVDHYMHAPPADPGKPQPPAPDTTPDTTPEATPTPPEPQPPAPEPQQPAAPPPPPQEPPPPPGFVPENPPSAPPAQPAQTEPQNAAPAVPTAATQSEANPAEAQPSPPPQPAPEKAKPQPASGLLDNPQETFAKPPEEPATPAPQPTAPPVPQQAKNWDYGKLKQWANDNGYQVDPTLRNRKDLYVSLLGQKPVARPAAAVSKPEPATPPANLNEAKARRAEQNQPPANQGATTDETPRPQANPAPEAPSQVLGETPLRGHAPAGPENRPVDAPQVPGRNAKVRPPVVRTPERQQAPGTGVESIPKRPLPDRVQKLVDQATQGQGKEPADTGPLKPHEQEAVDTLVALGEKKQAAEALARKAREQNPEAKTSSDIVRAMLDLRMGNTGPKARTYAKQEINREQPESRSEGTPAAPAREAPPADEAVPVGAGRAGGEGQAGGKGTGPVGLETRIATQSGDVPARYEAVEADSLIPSHDERTFAPNPEHSGGQMRDYAGDLNEQQKVIDNSKASKFDSRQILSDDPGPANGPPMVDERSSAIGGNSRSMIAKRVYADRMQAASLKADTVKSASKFGIDPAHVQGMQKPVIVRRLAERGMSADRLAEMSRTLQKGRTQETSSTVDAISRARILEGKPELMHTVETLLQGGDSVRDILGTEGKSRKLLHALQHGGILTQQEVGQYATPQGTFSEEGKRLVERIMLATVVKDPHLMEDVPQPITNKLTGSLASLAYTKTREGWSLEKPIQKAFEAYHRFRADGGGTGREAFDKWVNGGSGGDRHQFSLVSDPIQSDPQAKSLLKSLVTENTAEFKQRLTRYAEDARSTDPNQSRMFGTEDIKPGEAFDKAFGGKLPDQGSMFLPDFFSEYTKERGEKPGYLSIGHGIGRENAKADLWWMENGRVRREQADVGHGDTHDDHQGAATAPVYGRIDHDAKAISLANGAGASRLQVEVARDHLAKLHPDYEVHEYVPPHLQSDFLPADLSKSPVAAEGDSPRFSDGRQAGVVGESLQRIGRLSRSAPEVVGDHLLTPADRDAQRVAAKLGITLHYVAGRDGSPLPFRGVVDPENPQTMFIRHGVGEAVRYVFGHELVHNIRMNDPDLYEGVVAAMDAKAISRESLNYAKNVAHGASGGNELGQHLVGKFMANPDKLEEEGVANVMGDAMSDPRTWAQLAERSPSLWQKVVGFFRDLMDRMRGVNKRSDIALETYMKFADRLNRGPGLFSQDAAGESPSFLPNDNDEVSVENLRKAVERLSQAKTPAQVKPSREDLSQKLPSVEGRSVVSATDAIRNTEGKPAVRKDAAVEARARAFASNPQAVRDRVFEAAKGGEILNDHEMQAAHMVLNSDSIAAVRSNDGKTVLQAARLADALRTAGSEWGRAGRQMRDPIQSPIEKAKSHIARAIVLPVTESKPGEPSRFDADAHVKEVQAIKQQLKGMGYDLDELLKGPVPTAAEAQGGNGNGNGQAAGVGGGPDLSNMRDREPAGNGKPGQKNGQPVSGQGLQPFEAPGGEKGAGGKQRELFNLDDAANIIREIQARKSSLGDKIYEYWVNSLLGPHTQTHKAASDTAGLATSLLYRPIEASINQVVGAKGGATFGEIPHVLRGMVPGIQRAAENWLRTFKTERPVFDDDVNQDFTPPRAAIPGKLGRAVRLQSRILSATTQFAKSLSGTMQAHAEAYRDAVGLGLDGDQLADHIAQQVGDLSSPVWHRALGYGNELSFSGEPGKLGRALNTLKYQMPVFKYIGIGPFANIGAKMTTAGLKMTPLDLIRMAYKGGDNYFKVRGGEAPTYSRKDFVSDAARQLVSFGVGAAIYGGVGGTNPWITGSAASFGDKGKREDQYRNAPPMSVKIGGKWYSYAHVEPIATALGTMVNGIQSIKEARNGKDATDAAGDFLASGVNMVRDKTFLKAMGDLISVVQDPKTKAGEFASNFVSSWIPNTIRQPLRDADPMVRERRTLGPGGGLQAFGRDVVRESIPGVDLPSPKVDLWGRDIEKGPNANPATDFLYRLLSPVGQSPTDTRRMDHMITAWNTAHPTEEYHPQTPDPVVRLPGQKPLKMDEPTYNLYLRATGRVSDAILNGPLGQKYLNADNPTADDMKGMKRVLQNLHTNCRQLVGEALLDKQRGNTAGYENAMGYLHDAAQHPEKFAGQVPEGD